MADADATTERTADTEDVQPERVLALRGILPNDDALCTLRVDEISIGRGEESQFQLNFPGVSRLHAVVQKSGPLHTLRDLGSRNGTYINGKRIEHAPLTVGAIVRIGDWLGIVSEVEVDQEDQRFAEIAPGLWGGAVLARAAAPLFRAATSTVSVLLVGRTGSGKERIARALHDLSSRKGRFHGVNCAALPADLAEGELFGYRRGAFTGADRGHLGQMRAASGGTLFLDEISDLSLPIQAKLLRALDTFEVTPLGEVSSTRTDVRLVTATQQPLPDLVRSGRFREDLAARICGLTVTLPELDQRVADIPSLFALFLREHSGNTAPSVSTKLYERLCLYAWPANVRELEQLARRLLATHGLEPRLRRSFLPDELREHPTISSVDAFEGGDRNERDLERLRTTLGMTGGNVIRAAKMIGISRQRAYRLIGSRRLTGLVAAIRDDSGGSSGGRSG